MARRDEAEPVPDPAGAGGDREDDEVEEVHALVRSLRCRREQARVGEEAGVRHHAVVGPHRLAVDVPGALQHLERLDHAERRAGELLAQP